MCVQQQSEIKRIFQHPEREGSSSSWSDPFQGIILTITGSLTSPVSPHGWKSPLVSSSDLPRATATERDIQWWFQQIHPLDLPAIKFSLANHFGQFKDVARYEARLWYAEYRVRRNSVERDGINYKGKGKEVVIQDDDTGDDDDDTYILIGDRLQTSRTKSGYPLISESNIFDLVQRNKISRPIARRKSSSGSGYGYDDSFNFRSVIDDTHSGIFMMNPAGYVTYMNTAAEELTGFKVEEIDKITFHEAVHSLYPDGSPYPHHLCPVYLHQRDLVSIKEATAEFFITKSGRFFPIVYSVAPLKGGYREGGAVIEFRDVSKEVEMQEEKVRALVEAEKQESRVREEEMHRQQMGEFIDYICHEVRNPLHGIKASTSFLNDALKQLDVAYKAATHGSTLVLTNSGEAQNGNTDEEDGESSDPAVVVGKVFEGLGVWLKSIEDCASHQSSIINNVLDLSRLEAGRFQRVQILFNPYEAVREAIGMVEPKARERRLKLQLEVSSEDVKGVEVRGDPTTIKQIYLNLLTNACKFSHPGGIVTAKLGVRVDSQRLLAILEGSVEDHGVGMDEHDRSKLFQRFSQVNRVVSAEYGGSGLGLNISRELVSLLNGTLEVKSEKGVGSCFSFHGEMGLAPTATAYRQQSPSDKLAAEMGSVSLLDESVIPKFTNILAAEDNALNRKILGRYLRKRGTVTLTENGQEALDYFKAHPEVQLVVMDCEMPVLDGRMATKAIRAFERQEGLERRVPIVGLSGNVRESQITTALECGMDDYLSKPCSQQTLDNMIARWERIVYLGKDEGVDAVSP